MNNLTLTKADDGKTISGKVGDLATISLAENPTTGFRWAIDQSDSQLIELKDSNYILPSGAGIGGGGTRQLTFELKKDGLASLKLKLWREWEGDASSLERFGVSFDIQN